MSVRVNILTYRVHGTMDGTTSGVDTKKYQFKVSHSDCVSEGSFCCSPFAVALVVFVCVPQWGLTCGGRCRTRPWKWSGDCWFHLLPLAWDAAAVWIVLHARRVRSERALRPWLRQRADSESSIIVMSCVFSPSPWLSEGLPQISDLDKTDSLSKTWREERKCAAVSSLTFVAVKSTN